MQKLLDSFLATIFKWQCWSKAKPDNISSKTFIFFKGFQHFSHDTL